MSHSASLKQDQLLIITAAKELAKRRTSGTTGDLLAEALRPHHFEQAFAIQQAVAKVFMDTANNPIAGWKCLLPTADKTVVAPIYQHDVYHQTPDCPLYPSTKGLARVEPELAFEIGVDLPPRTTPYTEAEIDAAIGKTHLALELIKSRYHTPSEATHFDALADGLVNQGLWLGPTLNTTDDIDLNHFNLTIKLEGGDIQQKEAIHPNGFPKAGLYWLVNFLSTQGIGLAKGQYVITGSYAGVLDLPLQQIYQFEYGKLGQFEVRFVAK
ncbi:hydratase [Shewanella profunda]|uniref:hydratase n=1 Tax=Shewanella profunda TaxID=254793 RepID=UPI00200F759D|nr:hydratase [Shewanella profunda]MCL1091403.1 hydratase [Shewanella profunda]